MRFHYISHLEIIWLQIRLRLTEPLNIQVNYLRNKKQNVKMV